MTNEQDARTQRPKKISTRDVRSAVSSGRVILVLAVSMVLALLAMAVLLLGYWPNLDLRR